MMTRVLVMVSVSAMAFNAASLHAAIAADSGRGAELFTTLACVQCHSVNGKGGTMAPDLGQTVDRNFTPASLAATMWNHAPTMWSSMRQRNMPLGELTEQGASDLFAFFYAARFFEQPGDAGRGKRVFLSKHCADCHGLTDAKVSGAPPVAQWNVIRQPIALVDAMWNHAATMRQEFAKRKIPWPELTAQDFADMLVYLRNVPAGRSSISRVEIDSGPDAQALFQSKGCAACHKDKAALARQIKGQTLTGIAVAMWNHEPRMAAAPAPLDVNEMRGIASDLWAEQFFADQGKAGAGERVFSAKRCTVCHNDAASGAPKLGGAGRAYTAATMVSVLWRHGPKMLDQMPSKAVAWPRFAGPEMANLIAYLNHRSGEK